MTCGEGARRADEGEERLVNQGLANRQYVPYHIAFYPCPSVVKIL